MVVTASSDAGVVSLEIRARRLRLGMSVKRLAELAGVNRSTLTAIEAGARNTYPQTLAAIRTALDRLEYENGMELPEGAQRVGDTAGGAVEFHLEGVEGVRSVVVRGPMRDIAALQAAVQALIAGMRTSSPEGARMPRQRT